MMEVSFSSTVVVVEPDSDAEPASVSAALWQAPQTLPLSLSAPPKPVLSEPLCNLVRTRVFRGCARGGPAGEAGAPLHHS